jgi:hypothetical protein
LSAELSGIGDGRKNVKYLLVLLAILMALTGAVVAVVGTYAGSVTGDRRLMIVGILWFGVSLALASLALKKFDQINREERNR